MSLLSVSNSLPVKNYSVIQASENAGNTWNPSSNSRIRLLISKSLGVVDFYSSFLKFNMTVTANYKMRFANGLGCRSVLKNMRVSVDGKVVEELRELPVLLKISQDYSEDFGMAQLLDTETLAATTNLQESSTVGIAGKSVQVIMMPQMSGLLNSRNAFPIMAYGDVEIEFDLAPANEIFEVSEKGFFKDAVSPDNQRMDLLAFATDEVAGNKTVFHLKMQQYEVTTAAGAGQDQEESNTEWLPAYSYCSNSKDCPIYKGCRVKITKNGDGSALNTPAVDVVVSSIEDDTTAGFENCIKVTLASNVALLEAEIRGVLQMEVSGDATAAQTAPTASYTIDNFEYILQVVDPPPGYLDSALKASKSEGGLPFDIPTWQTLISNTPANVSPNTIELPTAVSRAKSVLISKQKTAQDKDFLPASYDLRGQQSTQKNYYWQIKDNRIEPSRPVDCQNTNNGAAEYPSQEHIREVEKALRNSSIGVKNLREHGNNWVMARSLSAYGATTNLSPNGMRLYQEYTGNSPALQNYAFVNYIRRLISSPDGLVVVS